MFKKVFYCSSVSKCKLSSHLGNLVCNFLRENDFILTENPFLADAIVINTCGFDYQREETAIDLINNYTKKYLGKKKIIVCGCLPKINPFLGQTKSVLKKISLIGPREMDKFNQIFKHRIPIEKVVDNKIDRKFLYKFREDNYSILISQGCINNCAYCSIKRAKGDIQSKSLNKVIKEFKSGLESGFKLFTLLGDECGSYGLDIETNFAQLLNKINKIRGDFKITIYYFEPSRLEALFSEIDPSIFKRIHSICIPVQSMNQRIVDLMNRHYQLKNIFKIIKQIKKISPSTSLRTHIIYAYPTETEKEFLNNIYSPNLDYFNEIMLYCYSDKKGTFAATMSGKIKSMEMEKRIKMVWQRVKKDRRFILPDKIKD
ncbi:MAG: radical SAM protein [bacterium]